MRKFISRQVVLSPFPDSNSPVRQIKLSNVLSQLSSIQLPKEFAEAHILSDLYDPDSDQLEYSIVSVCAGVTKEYLSEADSE